MRGSVKGKKAKAPTLAETNEERWALVHSWAVELPRLLPEAMHFAASLSNNAVRSFTERREEVYNVVEAIQRVMVVLV